MADLEKVQTALGVRFKNPALLELALIHSSYLNERSGAGRMSNERLEFLGDAILGAYIAERLYLDFPSDPEGTLTRYRSLLVRRETLTRLAASLNLGAYLFLGRGEDASGGRTKPANLSRAMEAVIAAVYLDRGVEASSAFIQRLFSADLVRLEDLAAMADSKSKLQEYAQAHYQVTPSYATVDKSASSDEPHFAAEARIKDQSLGHGEGRSKKEAEARAASDALSRLNVALHPGDPLLNWETE